MRTRIIVLAVATFLASTGISSAHHATATEYDISKTITLKGAVSKIDWGNPHVRAHVDVKTQAGIEDWEVEFGSPGAMAVAGIVKDALKPGTILTIKAYPGKPTAAVKSPRRACATEATLPDGLKATFVVGI